MMTTTPVPTTTPTTCAKFTCTTPWEKDTTKLAKVCAAPGCTSKDCCLCKTTTPKPITCAAYPCPVNIGWVTDVSKKNKECRAANVGGSKVGMDAQPGCDRRWCCKFLTTTPVPTTTPQTCAGFQCGTSFGIQLVAFPQLKICPTTGCKKVFCCVCTTTTPKPPVVPVLTCASPLYTCSPGWKAKGAPMPKTVCPVGGCTRNVCCDIVITTTPKPPATCASINCPGDPWVSRHASFKDMVCTAGTCTIEQCCFHKTTTTQPTLCASWVCKGVWTPKNIAATEICKLNGVANVCSDRQCCECLTTTPAPTTTPPTYCSSWKCNTPWEPRADVATTVCIGNVCDNKQCCQLTCGGFICGGPPWTANPLRTGEPCDGGVCTKKQCCLCVTTTPAPVTCGTFDCGPAPWGPNPFAANAACTGGVCTKKQCCKCLTTTPGVTQAPNPCTTAAPARLYSAQQKQGVFQQAKKETTTSSYSMLFGMFALISVGCGVVVYKRSRRANQYTRTVNLVESLTDDEDIEAIE
jgi:hypothetical protein